MASVQSDAKKVQATIKEITLPTYEIIGENPNPVFHSRYGVAHIYPYTLQDEIASTSKEIIYTALILENKYLIVTVLPGLGGRVYSVFDKISGREVFYKNSIIKFSPLAIRGAFFSGGVEFSFPVAHAPTTADPVIWDIRQEDDGSASIFVGGLEHISGMRWTIKLSLFPDRCVLYQDVNLSNPTTIPGRYHYWTNASMNSDDKTEFIYPFQRIRSYEFAGTASWPITRLDLIAGEPGLPGMEGVPMWPAQQLQTPIDFRWEKNMLAQVSIFGRKVNWNYFGAWQHSSNTGYAHYADHEDVSGMKLWSWGRSDVGIVNQTALTDDGSLYAETQCGAMETQLDFDFLYPGKSRRWRELWIPLRDLGGLTCASADIGARLYINQDDKEANVDIIIGICPVYAIKNAKIVLTIPGMKLIGETISVSPESPWIRKFTVDACILGAHSINLIVTDDKGRELMNYSHSRDVTQFNSSKIAMDTSVVTAEDYYQLGKRYENFDNRLQALSSYRKALLLNKQHSLTNLRLGLMLLRSGEFTTAGEHFQQAADTGLAEAYYYLGLISWHKGDIETAGVHYNNVPIGSMLGLSALRGQACIAMYRDEFENAIKLLSNYEAEISDEAYLGTLFALTHCYAGHIDEASNLFKQILNYDPLNLIVLRELSRIDNAEAKIYASKLKSLLEDDRQYILDLAVFYLDAGLLKAALSVLEDSINEWNYPIVYYLGAYIYQLLGLHDSAYQWREKGKHGRVDRVFPSRLWEIIALENALSQDPDDSKAKYFLANFLYAHQRYDEAILLWEQACKDLADFDVIHRNLGLAYWQQKNELLRAIEELEEAISINPANQDLYIHLDDLYCRLDLQEKRFDLLELIQKLNTVREDLRKRMLKMMIELDEHEAALKIMTEQQFVPLEMDQSFHDLYVHALLQKAEGYLRSNQVENAIEAYLKALEFPQNLGVGKPMTLSNAKINYLLGCAYEHIGKFISAIQSWREAAQEYHKIGDELYPFVQKSLDKLGRYSELGFHIDEI